MKWKELQAAFAEVSEDQLGGESPGENHFRYLLLRLLFEMNSNLDSLSASYRQMAKLIEQRNKNAK